MRKHHLITAIFIAIALVACSMPYIENVPDWMHGTWDMFTEDGEYIGRCEIDIDRIEIYPIDSSQSRDLINEALQNGGWAEITSESIFTIYDGITLREMYTFVHNGNSVDIEIGQGIDTTIITLQNRQINAS